MWSRCRGGRAGSSAGSSFTRLAPGLGAWNSGGWSRGGSGPSDLHVASSRGLSSAGLLRRRPPSRPFQVQGVCPERGRQKLPPCSPGPGHHTPHFHHILLFTQPQSPTQVPERGIQTFHPFWEKRRRRICRCVLKPPTDQAIFFAKNLQPSTITFRIKSTFCVPPDGQDHLAAAHLSPLFFYFLSLLCFLLPPPPGTLASWWIPEVRPLPPPQGLCTR